MKIKSLIAGACIAATSVSIAQNNILSTSPEGYLSRGVTMYNDSNYIGAIDQLKHLESIAPKSTFSEEAAFYIAMSRYQCGEDNAIRALKEFINDYPVSAHVAEAWFTIGNKYFYDNKYGEAVMAYGNIPANALSGNNATDCIYRKAYSNLKLANYDKARNLFESISYNAQYRETSTFYIAYIDYTEGKYDSAMNLFSKVNRQSELGYNAQYYMAQIYFIRNDYEKVISIGRALLNDNRNGEYVDEINRIVGESYYHMGEDSTALSFLDKYLTAVEYPHRSAQYIAGVINYKEGNYNKALECLTDVTETDDALAQSAYLYAGQAYVKENNISAASIAFEKAFKMPFDRTVQETAFYNYAIAQNSGVRTPFSKSIDIFEEFINKYPDSSHATDIEEYLVNAYINGNDYTKALESISHIKSPSKKVLKAKQYVLYNLGIDAISNNRPTAAADLFKESLSLGELDPKIYNDCNLWLGESLYRKGEYAPAKKYLQSFVSKTNIANPNYSLGLYLLGYTQFQQREYSQAQGSFNKIIANRGSLSSQMLADAVTRIADCQYYAKQYSQAEASYDKALSISPEGGDYALFQKAMMAGLTKQHANKIKMMDDLLSRFYSSHLAPSAMLEKGLAQIALSNNSAAVTTFERLLAKYPQSIEARKGLLQLAITEKTLGSESKAIASYKQVITKYPSSEEATLAAEDLKVIYADNGNMDSLARFLNDTPNAPKIEVSEMDKLTFFAAEKAFMSDKGSISKIKEYTHKFPNGAYASTAQFYLAKDFFAKGKYDTALESIDKVLANASDASYAEDAIAMKAAILFKQGHATDALISYTELAKKATTNDNRITGYLGAIRTAKELNRHTDVVENANALLALSGLSAEEEKETLFLRAAAHASLNHSKEAIQDWSKLAIDGRNIYGAQSSFLMAEHYFEAGNLKEAEKVLNKFIDSGTPHQYWLARGFILLSDVYRKKGDAFEAREYLESLQSNYPGKEPEIFNMIDERLKSMKK